MDKVDSFTREDVLEQMLQQAVWTIEFLHGCLTDPHQEGVPGGCSYNYPEQTIERLEEFRSILPESKICIHSKTVKGCLGCEAGNRSRQIMSWWREVLGEQNG